MSDIYYRIIDDKGNFVDQYSFQQIPINKGKQSKWYYISYTGYPFGSILYSTADGNIVKLLEHLKSISSQLGLHKEFKIIQYDINNILNENIVLVEKI